MIGQKQLKWWYISWAIPANVSHSLEALSSGSHTVHSSVPLFSWKHYYVLLIFLCHPVVSIWKRNTKRLIDELICCGLKRDYFYSTFKTIVLIPFRTRSYQNGLVWPERSSGSNLICINKSQLFSNNACPIIMITFSSYDEQVVSLDCTITAQVWMMMLRTYRRFITSEMGTVLDGVYIRAKKG